MRGLVVVVVSLAAWARAEVTNERSLARSHELSEALHGQERGQGGGHKGGSGGDQDHTHDRGHGKCESSCRNKAHPWGELCVSEVDRCGGCAPCKIDREIVSSSGALPDLCMPDGTGCWPQSFIIGECARGGKVVGVRGEVPSLLSRRNS